LSETRRQLSDARKELDRVKKEKDRSNLMNRSDQLISQRDNLSSDDASTSAVIVDLSSIYESLGQGLDRVDQADQPKDGNKDNGGQLHGRDENNQLVKSGRGCLKATLAIVFFVVAIVLVFVILPLMHLLRDEKS
jgi:hypothetical protein